MRASSATGPDCAVVVAGGAGRRLGGVDKPALAAGGRTLLDIVLTAVAGARVVVVGPPRIVPAGVVVACEEPPGSGPAAAVVTGLALLPEHPQAVVAVLAADLPGLTAGVIDDLVRRLRADTGLDGVVAAGADDRPQWLTGVWRSGALRSAAARRSPWTDRSVRELLSPLRFAVSAGAGPAVADLDTPADLARWRESASRPVQSPPQPDAP